MNVLEKARILSDSGNYDSCGFKACQVKVREGLGGIYYAKAEHKTCRIFKTLMDNDCKFDCKYCQNAVGCKKQKVSYEPEELAKVFMHLHKNLAVEGLFLSSAISRNPDQVTEKMIEAVRLVRYKYGFKGYVHFKVLPGTSYDMIKRASELSNRMSINIEAPNKNALSEVSTCKDYKIDILRRQSWLSRINLPSGQTTQMIIDKRSNDKDVLKMVNWEYESFNMHRIYYSSFRPVVGTPLENDKAEPQSRQNHLYNVDFLMRTYGYKIKEFDQILNDGMLPNEDPKIALAKQTIDRPIDINQSSYEELIRIPGIGPVTADKIIQHKINSFIELKNLGVRLNVARPFIELNGKRQLTLAEYG